MKSIKGKGEMDYDFKNDILFFKAKGREYDRSLELENIILDIDKEGYVTGIQIFEASEFLNTPKRVLKDIPRWTFQASVSEGKLEVRLAFKIRVRNKVIEKNPIIMESLNQPLPDSEIICAV